MITIPHIVFGVMHMIDMARTTTTACDCGVVQVNISNCFKITEAGLVFRTDARVVPDSTHRYG